MPTLYALSISHKKAPLNIREAFSLDEIATKQFLYELRNVLDIAEALVISTCNRTEIYYLADNEQNNAIIRLLCIQKNITNNVNDFEEISNYFETFDTETTAAQHLFRVAIGLESQVVGDMQIPNQVKHAYQWTADVQMAGAFLHRLMHSIFYTNKKITQETAFRDGAASTSFATVELIETLTADIETPKVLVLGLGEIGTDVCKNLAQRNFTNVSICNRTQEKAQNLALECGFEMVDFENVWENITNADVIISSIATETPFINKNTLKNAFEDKNILSYKYFIDLAVPRSVAEDVENITGTIVYNIDNIQMRADEAMRKRLQAIPHVEKIIAEALQEFSSWTQEMEVSPTINKLKNALEQIRKEEIARFVKELSPVEEELVDRISKSMMQKIIKLPVIQLKAACKRGEASTLIDVLNDLFDLEK